MQNPLDQGAEHEPLHNRWTSTRALQHGAGTANTTANAFLMPQVPVTSSSPAAQVHSTHGDSLAKPSWEPDVRGCRSTGTRRGWAMGRETRTEFQYVLLGRVDSPGSLSEGILTVGRRHNASVSYKYQSKALLALPGGFTPEDRAQAQQEHTRAMQGRQRAGTVPTGRARSPRPGLASLAPLGCPKCYDLPAQKQTEPLAENDPGVTEQTSVCEQKGKHIVRAPCARF